MNNIILTSVTKNYGETKAVDAIDLTMSAGECLALVGHNGAGKSTVIKMVLGLIKPTLGTVTVLGHDPMAASFNAVRRVIGFLPEQVLFQQNMTGRETLEFYARLKEAPRDNLDGLFHRVDLLEAADNRISTYSKGMRQRLGLAQALIGAPKLLILDEPTSGLDPISRQNIYSIINDIKCAGATVLISSHALSELDNHIDRVVILQQGKITAQGSIGKLRQSIGLATEIKVHAPMESLEILMQHFGDKCLINGVAYFSCSFDNKVDLIKRLMGFDIPINNIEVNDPSLEEVFFSLTQKEESSHELAHE